MKKLTLLIFLSFGILLSIAQSTTQTVKGIVVDKISEKPLAGATVSIGTSATVTNADGKFYLNNIATGRITIVISNTGYKSASIPEVLVTAGKEVIIDVLLEQDVKALTAITVKSQRTKKGNASNEYAGASSRSFSMEEVTRFAGGRNDPSKLVSSFAGVISNNDSRNDIVVRGNAPTGVLWRLEGVPTPNPNHYATSGTTGGPVSALNTNALKTSDFYTGAFPAEYGNATAAVFDLQLRNGNSDRHEKTIQLNLFSGLEAMMEGPLSSQKNGSSYMVGYRYSFIQIGQSLGLDVGTKAIPKYQDWVYNIQFAKGKAGKLNLFGMGGISDIDFLGKDTDTTDFYSRKDQDGYARNHFMVFGAKHSIDIGSKSYLRTVATYANTKSDFEQFQYALPLTYARRWKSSETKNSTNTFRFSTFLNTKFNAQWSMRSGILAESQKVEARQISKEGKPESAPFEVQEDYSGTAVLWQAYSQFRYKPSDVLTLSFGLHGMYYGFNDAKILEPRGGINWQIDNQNSLQFNYGLHGQQQVTPVYLRQQLQPDGRIANNRHLDFTKAHHFVLAYERRIGQNWRLKAETYYQYLFDVPVEKTATGFSLLNAGAGFDFPDKAGLVNKGTGTNIGAELTVERFLSNGFYLLATGSLFDSKYKGSDNIERSTSFNYGYAGNLLAGKEWKMGKSQKNAFTLDIKLTTIGGSYTTPVNLSASIAAGQEILDETRYNSIQQKGYFRLDTKFGFRLNSSKRKLSHTFYLDLQNVTNNKNIFLSRYNPERQTVGEVNQIGFFPDILYRLQF
jgi:hypothetical protein